MFVQHPPDFKKSRGNREGLQKELSASRGQARFLNLVDRIIFFLWSSG
jgi:hypothetical protein